MAKRKSTKKEEAKAVEDAKYVVFIIDGGIGKNIMATVPIRGIKQKYPDKKVVVVCGYPDVFKFNPNVHRVHPFGMTPDFYDNYIVDEQAIVLKAEPYLDNRYIYKHGPVHCTQLWCEALDVPFDNPIPDLHLNKKELGQAKDFVVSKNRPVLLVQYTGGVPPQPQAEGQPPVPAPKMFARNLPMQIAKHVADELSEKYHVMVAGAATQPVWEGAERISYPLRQTLSIIPHVHKLLLIDSCIQHAAAALGKQAVVCWCGTSPDLLGYPFHINLRMKECPTPECHRPNSYLWDRDARGQPWDCPHGEACVWHDEADILAALKKSK
jgi:hypothetical protein